MKDDFHSVLLIVLSLIFTSTTMAIVECPLADVQSVLFFFLFLNFLFISQLLRPLTLNSSYAQSILFQPFSSAATSLQPRIHKTKRLRVR